MSKYPTEQLGLTKVKGKFTVKIVLVIEQHISDTNE
jgi:hypothetical protein